jgi:hypothetical protein
MTTRNARRRCLIAVMLSLAAPASAHHSFAGFYDADDIIEIEGIVRAVSWRNPHGALTIEVRDAAGESTLWEVETGSISVLRVRGLDRAFVGVRDRVRLAGERALRRPNGLYARNMLLASGEEVLLSIGIQPRWTDPETGRLLEAQFDESTANAARRSADGIFRVWATVLDDPESFPMFKGGYPLTEAARARKAEWDPSSVVLLGCAPKGMPSLMISPYPMELIDEGDRIRMRLEEDEAVRVIYLRNAPDDPAPSLLGRSVGRWEESTLVVETDRVSAKVFDTDGTPQSPRARFIERFTLNAAEDRLDYRITVADSATFTESFDLTRYWIWRPELSVNAYDCVASE